MPTVLTRVCFESHVSCSKVRSCISCQVTLAVKENGWDGNDAMEEAAQQWSFAGALLYAVTVITTIGTIQLCLFYIISMISCRGLFCTTPIARGSKHLHL